MIKVLPNNDNLLYDVRNHYILQRYLRLFQPPSITEHWSLQNLTYILRPNSIYIFKSEALH